MIREKSVIQDLLKEADITINGSQPWDIIVHNDAFYQKILTNTELTFGETYMDKWWDSGHLDQLFYKILKANLDEKALAHPLFWRSALKRQLFNALQQMINFQSRKRSLTVGKKHYDIGNDLYQIMLGERMVYTCAYWEDANTLDEAQENKLKLTCLKLDLKPGMTLLDIGCGWGSLAQYAAEHYGVSVVGITISKEQCTLAQQRCRGLPVEIRFQDYRDLAKEKVKFDRVVSLGMFEHVGYKNYLLYMQIVAHCLKEDGLFLLHTIGSNSANRVNNSWIDAYIFPNGEIPTIARMGSALEPYFVMEDWHNFGVHYDKTLMAWHHNFNQGWDELKNHYDERFHRMWNYYLLTCAASFRARKNQLWQVVLSKQGLPQGFQKRNALRE